MDYPISTWQEIAYYIQELNFSDCSEEEFRKNMDLLKELLKNTKVIIKEGKRIAQTSEEVGLATLLQSIYAIDGRNKPIEFYDKIEDMKDIRIKNIQLIENIPLIDELGGIFCNNRAEKQGILTSKVFTDGWFYIKPEEKEIYNRYAIRKLQDFNYYLQVAISRCNTEKLIRKLLESKIVLKNFNVILPKYEEILSLEMPNLKTDWDEKISWQLTNQYISEDYKSFVRKREL